MKIQLNQRFQSSFTRHKIRGTSTFYVWLVKALTLFLFLKKTISCTPQKLWNCWHLWYFPPIRLILPAQLIIFVGIIFVIIRWHFKYLWWYFNIFVMIFEDVCDYIWWYLWWYLIIFVVTFDDICGDIWFLSDFACSADQHLIAHSEPTSSFTKWKRRKL